MFSYFANPQRFMTLSAWATPLTAALAAGLLCVGLIWGLLFSPADYLQGESVRIMYVHVPTAALALSIYVAMGVASLMGLVWGHLLAHAAARAAAPIGCAFAGICLVTGSLWGQPTWGTWWVWDARLTSMLVLFLTYVGYLALWAAIEDEARAARLAAILCLAGLINVPIVRYSVEWWSTLHQPASLDFVAAAAGKKQSIAPPLLWPLLISMLGFAMAAAAFTLAGMRAEVNRRRALSLIARKATA